MSSDYTIACDELLSEPDNLEIIRDQLAYILAAELANQHTLAVEAEDANARDYQVGVYVENDDPIQYVDKDHNPFPLVNVSIDTTVPEGGTATVNKQKNEATVLLDVYATGNAGGSEDAGTRASLKVWKTARLVRRILRAEANTYLRLRGVVDSFSFDRFQAGDPANKNSAVRVKMVRITLKISYREDVTVTSGPIIEDIEASICDATGEVIVSF